MSDSASPAAEMNEISPETAKLSDVPSSKTEVDDALPQPNDTCDVPSPTADTNEAPSPTGEVNDGSSPDDELSNPRSPTTRTREFSAEKGKYLEMPIEEKRELYRVKKFVELKDIPTWQSYYCEREDCLRKDYDKDLAEIADSSPTKNVELNEKISLWQGDITFLEVDAIVNAANSSLLGGGGVDGAIHRAAGPFLKKECSTLNGCETGDAKITGGYKLPAKYVIHTVGPKGEDSDLLKSCYTRSLELMLENNIRTIAFPCISTGIYGYPQDSAANVALSTVRTFLEKNAEKVDRIIFTLFLDEDVEIYETLTQVYFPIQSQDSPKE